MSEMELFATIAFVTKDSTIDIGMGPGYVSNKKNSNESSKCLLLYFLKTLWNKKKQSQQNNFSTTQVLNLFEVNNKDALLIWNKFSI